MLRRVIRMTLWLVITAGVGFVLAKLVQSRRAPAVPGARPSSPPSPLTSDPVPGPDRTVADEPSPADAPVVEAPSAAETPAAADATPTAADASGPPWVEPNGGGCPVGYDIKAKMTSGIFHVPGGTSYERVHPDRCYRSAEAAEADGLRAARR